MAATTPQAIVVGAGLSGLSAAYTLYEKGANVLVLEKSGFAGGNSTKATSGINGAGTKEQENLGIRDSATTFFNDTKKSARDLARDDLIEVLTSPSLSFLTHSSAEPDLGSPSFHTLPFSFLPSLCTFSSLYPASPGKSGDAVNWLVTSFGLDLSKVSRLGGHSVERTHRGGAQFPGMTITMALIDKLDEVAKKEPARVKLLKKAHVAKLLKEGDCVTGVEYQYGGKTHQAHGPVILATGGYASDFSPDGLLAKYRPELLDLPTTNGDHSTGEGHKMAMAIGASAVDLEKVQVHPTGLVDEKEVGAKTKFLAAEALRGVGGLLLDAEGNRFCDELGHRDYVTGRIWENNKNPTKLILNGEASKEIEWHAKHYTGRKLMKRFDTLAQVASEMSLPLSKLQETLGEYEMVANSKGEKKDVWGKKFFSNTKWTGEGDGPFHVALMTPVLHYTMGGLEISPTAHVLDKAHKPIPGLFASGEIAGGVHGANRLGGSSLLGCVVYGRVAGDAAASYLLQSLSSSNAAARLGQVQQHLAATPLSTTISIDPTSQKVNLSFSWSSDSGSSASDLTSTQPQLGGGAGTGEVKPQGPSTASEPANEGVIAQEVKDEKTKSGGKVMKEFSMEEVGKHDKKEDCWVVVNGQVLDVTTFLDSHPGGSRAILLYAGRECTEEFLMLHDLSVIPKYAPDVVIGTVKA
ncbi:hypothetical protein JCM11641_003546 [Rhodosporidiobolus odoratus]